ncbi:alpha/beta fold hydrolase [Vibrio pectenicida]|uniref:Alpha/beta hydrolase n=1 Tax=Vibrio pectenicida TaxID=62763 RepID=A0A427U7Q7_9VIBR|nr:alpha/beta hydrolase [Vibrio pectenicida]RSD32542.1 alpha/beta hydrolase [Vibrio pectenicida]
MKVIQTILDGNHYRYSFYPCRDSKQTLIFLLGALQDIESVQSFSTHFATKINCLTVEVPGTGNTQNLASTTSIREQAKMLHNFINHLDISTAHLAGFSYATAIAVELCDIWPNVQSMSICGGVPGIPTSGRLATKKMIAASMDTSKTFATSFTESLTVRNSDIPKNEAIIRATKRNIAAMSQDRIDMFFENSVRLLVHTPSNIHSITVPCTICVGEFDPYVTMQTAQNFANQLKHSHLVVIKNADHLVHLQHPKKVAAIMLAQAETQQTLLNNLESFN